MLPEVVPLVDHIRRRYQAYTFNELITIEHAAFSLLRDVKLLGATTVADLVRVYGYTPPATKQKHVPSLLEELDIPDVSDADEFVRAIKLWREGLISEREMKLLTGHRSRHASK